MNLRLRIHLPLIVPSDIKPDTFSSKPQTKCEIRVGYQIRSWKEGKSIVLDHVKSPFSFFVLKLFSCYFSRLHVLSSFALPISNLLKLKYSLFLLLFLPLIIVLLD